MARKKTPKNPADRVFSIRVREPIRFPDLSERRALKMTALPHYAARAHFGVWHRQFGEPRHDDPDRVFTPLVYVELDSEDVPVRPNDRVLVKGKTELARTLDENGETRNLARDGRYDLFDGRDVFLARVRFVNFFTRDDPDPARRRIVRLPPSMGIGEAPTRVVEVPRVDDFVPVGRDADFPEPADRVWHYGQTDPNRHVNAFEYVRSLEEHVATSLARAGHDLARTFVRRMRIVYRKPCFRGETYRRVAWITSEAPFRIVAAVRKSGDAEDALPAMAVELGLDRHA